MKKFALAAFAALLSVLSYAQTPVFKWGAEFKMKKGGNDLAVIGTDNTGIYLKEEHNVMSGYFLFAATFRGASSLIKLDLNLNQVYNNDFNKELRKKEFERFFFCKDKLFILATDYIKRELTYKLFAAEVNKSTGDLAGDWKEIASISKESKEETILFKEDYNADSTGMILVSTITGRSKNSYEILEFNSDLQPVGKSLTISNEFNEETYSLEDVIFTQNKTVVLVGKHYEYEEGKKQKAKNLVFKNYNVRIYNNKGGLIKEVNTENNNKWVVSTRVEQLPGKDLVMASFYSNQKKSKEINGLLVQRISPVNGDITLTTDKEISSAMISERDTVMVESTKSDKKNQDTASEKGFSRDMRFRKFVITPDNGLLILAEKYDYEIISSSYYSPGLNNSSGSWHYITTQVDYAKDIMMCKLNTAGNVDWLNILPKNQLEATTLSSRSSSSGLYFSHSEHRIYFPYYISFGVYQPDENSINLVFNDHTDNINVLTAGQKPKMLNDHKKTDCFLVNLNLITGKYTRTSLFNIADIPSPMPRFGRVVNNDFYVIGRADRSFAKTKILVGRLSVH